MKPYLPILPFLIVFPYFLAAQYQQGSLKFIDGQVQSGYLLQDSDVELNARVWFKPDLSIAAERAYGPHDVQQFTFDDGVVFESVTATYQDGEIRMQHKAFARVIARGSIDLLVLQLSVHEDEFVLFARKDGRLHQLNELHDQEISHRLANGNHYRGLLNALTYDCRQRVMDIRELPFSRRRIMEVINQYNACRDKDYQPVADAYKVARERRLFAEFFGGTIVGRRIIGTQLGGDRIRQREVFASAGMALQMEVFKPSLSRRLLVHSGLEAYKWVAIQEESFILPPFISLALNMSAHYQFHQGHRLQWYSRLGGTFIFDLGRDVIPRPGMVFGFGCYGANGGRFGIQVSTLTFFGGEGITTWRLGYAIPLATFQR